MRGSSLIAASSDQPRGHLEHRRTDWVGTGHLDGLGEQIRLALAWRETPDVR